MSDKKVYVRGNKSQFAFSSDKNFIIEYTTPSFIYYKDSEASNIKDYPEEKRLKYIEKLILDKNKTIEEKYNLSHCILCVKFLPINNTYRYCCNCQYNSREKNSKKLEDK